MHYLPIYLVYSFLLRLYLFFRHWYYDHPYRFLRRFLFLISRLESFFFVRNSINYYLRPSSPLSSSHQPKVSFRFLYLLLGLLLYLFLTAAALASFLLWASLPLLVVLGFLNQLNWPTL